MTWYSLAIIISADYSRILSYSSRTMFFKQSDLMFLTKWIYELLTVILIRNVDRKIDYNKNIWRIQHKNSTNSNLWSVHIPQKHLHSLKNLIEKLSGIRACMMRYLVKQSRLKHVKECWDLTYSLFNTIHDVHNDSSMKLNVINYIW